MILSDFAEHETLPATNPDAPSLDDLLARAAAARPDAVALADSPAEDDGAGRPPLRLTYAQADRIVSALADRLRRLGLTADHVVALHMPNSVEAALALLGVARAGMIAAPMPLLWRRAEATAALARIGARAIIACGRAANADLAELATHVAAEVFPIRAVCGFGPDLPDGVVPLDPLLAADPFEPAEQAEAPARANGAAHVAVVTWEMDPAGPLPVARSHAELMAAGLAVAIEGAIAPGAAIVTTIPPCSFAGLASGLAPWLATGGTLCFARPFDAEALGDQLEAEDAGVLVIPGPLARLCAASGLLARAPRLGAVLGVWRAPERLASAPEWRDSGIAMVDVQAFGETGLIAARRDAEGWPAAIPLGAASAPRGADDGMLAAEIARSAAGTLALRGPMTPRFCFPPGAEQGAPPFLKIDDDFFVDTGYACRIDRDTGAMIVTAPPPGVAAIGGYRVPLAAFQQIIAEIDPGATLAALPDALTGQRLAGRSGDDAALRRALMRRGVNPLVVGAFRERRAADPVMAHEPPQRRAG